MELIGNVSTTDESLHRRIVVRMEVGNLFSRRNPMASLRNVSKLKTIYPVTMKDVVAQLDQAERTLDLRICIKERPHPRQTRKLIALAADDAIACFSSKHFL
jgi:hypothetical protein